MSYFKFTDLISSLLDPRLIDQLWSTLVHKAFNMNDCDTIIVEPKFKNKCYKAQAIIQSEYY